MFSVDEKDLHRVVPCHEMTSGFGIKESNHPRYSVTGICIHSGGEEINSLYQTVVL